ncbi:hypothetical protein GCM10010378_70310 [Streptomyces viridochromogenes]
MAGEYGRALAYAEHPLDAGAEAGPLFQRQAIETYLALTCEESTTQRDQPRRAAAFSSASRTSCNRCQTPASFQSRSLRQHVIPDPKPRSLGSYSH